RVQSRSACASHRVFAFRGPERQDQSHQRRSRFRISQRRQADFRQGVAECADRYVVRRQGRGRARPVSAQTVTFAFVFPTTQTSLEVKWSHAMNVNVTIGGGKSNLENLNPEVGQRYKESDNEFGLASMDHFALPTKNIVLMEHFIREVLGGKPYYYAGFDKTDQDMGRAKHIFIRVGNVLMQCAEPKNGDMIIRKDDPNTAPHYAFTVSATDLEANCMRLR